MAQPLNALLITEPVTTLTDYAIAVESLIWAGSLLWLAKSRRQAAILFWAIAFIWVALASILGGTCHGFVRLLSPAVIQVCWQGVMISIGFASFFMLAGTVVSSMPARLHLIFLLAIGLKSVLHFSIAAVEDSFAYAVADYLSAMLIVLLLQLQPLLLSREAAARWLIAGVLVSGLAALVQGLRLNLATNFNHNDFYHVIQMVSLYCFWCGAKRLKDR